MDDAQIVQRIREAMDGYFEVDFTHCDRHVYDEGFLYEQAYDVVRSGVVLEMYPDRERWLFFGRVPGLRHERRFHGTALHVLVQWDADAEVFVVTMYRPRLDEWITETKRR